MCVDTTHVTTIHTTHVDMCVDTTHVTTIHTTHVTTGCLPSRKFLSVLVMAHICMSRGTHLKESRVMSHM